MENINKLKTLRKETKLSLSQCSSALKQTNGDIKQAKKLLKEWGENYADKKASRDVRAGAIFTYLHHNKKIGVLLRLLCETDFVAKNKEFQDLGNNLTLQIASLAPKSEKALLSSEYIKDPSITIEKLIKETVSKLGENIVFGGFKRFEL